MESQQFSNFGPECITILATYKCTAACKECCFECSPYLQERVPKEVILDVINQASKFSTLKYVVFSGGECFLLKDDLVEAIKHANSYNLPVRCITNGYWAVSKKAAENRLKPLIDAGLTEINFSTGDDHQQFVSFENILNGAITAANLGIKALIVVEGSTNSKFKYKDVINHPRYIQFMNNEVNTDKLMIINNVWIPFHEDRVLEHDDSLIRNPSINSKVSGCDNILENFVLTPSHQMASCCGLTMEHIPEMKIGDIRENRLEYFYYKQLEDFLKVWIYLDGPEKITEFAQKHNQNIRIFSNVHPCQTCGNIYRNDTIKQTLREHYHEVIEDVMSRFYLKIALKRHIQEKVTI